MNEFVFFCLSFDMLKTIFSHNVASKLTCCESMFITLYDHAIYFGVVFFFVVRHTLRYWYSLFSLTWIAYWIATNASCISNSTQQCKWHGGNGQQLQKARSTGIAYYMFCVVRFGKQNSPMWVGGHDRYLQCIPCII